YKAIPVAVCSEKVPDSEVPYLPKPIRFETLFPMLRKLLQGENVYGKSFIAPADRSAKNNGNVQRTVTIRQFNPNKGLLGALRFAEKNRQDIAILHGNKPVLNCFPLDTTGFADRKCVKTRRIVQRRKFAGQLQDCSR
ncbi:hypothetical protein, partial [Streptomyces sp. DSM 41493]